MRLHLRIGIAVLRWTLPADVRDDVVADLADEYGERVQSGEPVMGWLARQVVGGSLTSLRTRLRRQRPTGSRASASPSSSASMGHGPDPGRPGNPWLALSLRDLKYAVRQLRRSPGFAAIVVSTLAVGIGANTAMFSVVDTVLVSPLPYPSGERLGYVSTSNRQTGEIAGWVVPPDVVEMVDQVPGLEDAAFFSETVVGPMSGGDRPAHVRHSRVSWNVFDLLGVSPALGRGFVAEDGAPVTDTLNVPPTLAIISHGLWVRAFGQDPSVLGRRVQIWGQPHDIIGVMPPDFEVWTPPAMNVGTDMDVWTATRIDYDYEDDERRSAWFGALVLLEEGASFERIRAALVPFSQRQREAFVGHRDENHEFHVEPLLDGLTGTVRSTVWVLFAAVGFVLLIACTNVANLLLARGTTRMTEISVRHALGASRGQVLRQLLGESAVLAVAGALFGMALAYGAVDAIKTLAPPGLPRIDLVSVDLRALMATGAIGVAATFLAGLLPSLHTVRGAVGGKLRNRGNTGTDKRLQRGLVMVEVALSVALLAGTTLMIRTAINLQSMDLGFEPEGVLAIDATQLGGWQERVAFEAESLSRIRALPGVLSAGAVFPAPMNGIYRRWATWSHPEEANDPTAIKRSYLRVATPGYFKSVGLELLRGRGFDSFDLRDEPLAAIIDAALAARHWPGRDPVGETIVVDHLWNNPTEFVIAGVVENAPQWDHRDEEPTIYVSRGFFPNAELTYVVRTAGDPTLLAGPVRRIIADLRPEIPTDPYLLKRNVGDVLEMTRFVLVLLGMFAAVAVGLAGIGLYGVLAYEVRQRTREIGIRMALGADARNVRRSVVRESLSLTLLGLFLGCVVALMLGRALETQLFGVSATDPLSIFGVIPVVLQIALLAALIPSIRASRIQPFVAMEAAE